MHHAEHAAELVSWSLLGVTFLLGVVVGLIVHLRFLLMSQLDPIRAALDINTQAVADNTKATEAAVAALSTSVTPIDPAEVDALVATIHGNSNAVAANTAAILGALSKPPAT